MKVAYILRGLPGSGKTTLARKIVSSGGVIHSTDDFFMEGGRYRFNPNWLSEAHAANFFKFCESLKAGIPKIVLDNVNARREHFERYEKAAEASGYAICVIQMRHLNPEAAARRTAHRVPIKTIERTLANWEP